MILSLAILIILSLIFSRLFEKMQLPGLIGMLIAGILIGDSSGDYFYHILNNNEYNILKWVFVNEKVFQFSPEFRNLCLIIILFRAGLGIDRDNLKKIGYPALKMSIIPGLFEASI
ncbi:MAG: cation:proton antiporter, partial [SAR324 cluster bacterium]|nr:cation:proton antiporter [SAR324 cluster bacterium]